MDTSVFLLIIIFLVSLILVAVGLYIVLVLRELKASLERVNKVLDHVENITATVDQKIVGPTTSALGIVAAIKEGMDLFKKFQGSGIFSGHHSPHHEGSHPHPHREDTEEAF